MTTLPKTTKSLPFEDYLYSDLNVKKGDKIFHRFLVESDSFNKATQLNGGTKT